MGGCCCCAIARGAVSKKKRRLKITEQTDDNKNEVPKGGIDLDLTRVHPNIICMGFPSSGFESWYRNPYPEVLKYLDHLFPDTRGQYRVINLCSEKEHQYNATEYFHGQCVAFPFKDMTPCTLEQIPACMNDALDHIRNWRKLKRSTQWNNTSDISSGTGSRRARRGEGGGRESGGGEDKPENTSEPTFTPAERGSEMKRKCRDEVYEDDDNENCAADGVVAIHCKAGKGRTGLMACCLFLALDPERLEPEGVLDSYATARTENAKGLTHRSQRRYVRYYYQLLVHSGGQIPRFIPTILLKCVHLDKILQECGSSKFQFMSVITYQPEYRCIVFDISAGKKKLGNKMSLSPAVPVKVDDKTGSASVDVTTMLTASMEADEGKAQGGSKKSLVAVSYDPAAPKGYMGSTLKDLFSQQNREQRPQVAPGQDAHHTPTETSGGGAHESTGGSGGSSGPDELLHRTMTRGGDSGTGCEGLLVQGDLRIELLAEVGAKWFAALHVHTLFLESSYSFTEVDTIYKSQKLPHDAKISLEYTEIS